MKQMLLLLCLLVPTGLFAGQPTDDVWITIGTDAVNAVRSEFTTREWRMFIQQTNTNGDVTIIKVKERQLPMISRLMHHQFGRCGGYTAHQSYAEALIYLERDEAMAKQGRVNKLALNYTLDRAAEVNTVIGDLSEQEIINTINSLASYPTRYYTSQSSVDAANWLKGEWEAMASGRSDITVELISHSGYIMPSVMMTITGAHQPQDIIVIGGHLDSINLSGSSAPGADDDASGIATLSEVARAALSNGFKPARTVKFIGYAAEEVGLRGSADIAQAHVDSGANVIGVLQLDMTNYKGSTQDIWLMTDYTNAAQNDFIKNLIDTYTNATWNTSSCGYGCSDHASWHNRGFAASMPFESRLSDSNPRIHTANDTMAFLGNNANHAMKFAQMGAAYLVELAKGGLNGNAGSDPGPVGGGGGSTDTEVFNNDSIAIDGATQSSQHFYIDIPAGATNFTVSTSGSNGDIDLYTRYGAKATTSTNDCSSTSSNSNESCSNANPQSGVHWILVYGYSAFSNATLNVSYTVQSGNNAPNASFSTSTNELTASFTDSSSDSDGTIASWSWNFGDGTNSSQQSPNHTYNSDGTYTVTLTVTDNDGATDSASASVTVSAPTGNVLQNGVPVTGLGASTGNWIYYTIDVPSGASNLQITTSGGSGDADLYVRAGSQPTTSSYDCRPYRSGNAETCSFASPATTTYHIGLRAYSTFSGLTLTASFDTGGGGGGCADVTLSESNLSGSSGQWDHHTIEVLNCSTVLNASISGGSGDADLYVREGSQPTTSSYNCRPYRNGNNETCTINSPAAGTWYVSLRAYSTYSGVSLSASALLQ